MSKTPDAVLLALIATLEDRAKRNGEKSIVKGVVSRLREAGESAELIEQFAALRPKKPAAAKTGAAAKPAKLAKPAKSNGKTNGKAKASAKKAASADLPIVAG